MSNPNMSLLDSPQVIRSVYNATNESLDVTLVGTTSLSINSAEDSIAIANAAGTPLTINSDGSIDVKVEGLNAFQTSQVTVGTSAVQLTPTPLSNRTSISIKVLPGNSVYIGNSNAVTTSTGYFLFSGDALNMDLTGSDQIWAISTSAAQTVAVLEIGG